MTDPALRAVVGTGTPLGPFAAGPGSARSLGMPLGEPAAAGRMTADAPECGRVRDIDP